MEAGWRDLPSIKTPATLARQASAATPAKTSGNEDRSSSKRMKGKGELMKSEKKKNLKKKNDQKIMTCWKGRGKKGKRIDFVLQNFF